MNKTYLVFAGLLLVGGCLSLEQLRTENQQNLMKLTVGMTREEVMKIMGTSTVTARDSFLDIQYGRVTPAATNPYRSETLQGKEKVFAVLYYYTDIKKDDRAITDDELTPMVFDDDKLIGWGWSFLNANVQKYEIRLR